MNHIFRMVFVLLLPIYAWTAILFAGQEAAAVNDTNRNGLSRQEYTIYLREHYLDGEIQEETVLIEEMDMEEVFAQYQDWELVDISAETIIFKKQINDISPLLKANGFFGVSRDGTLSIFNGKPDHNKVIQSFYQIDIGKLESKKKQELVQGIPVRSRDEFIQVLEAYKPYRLTEKNEG